MFEDYEAKGGMLDCEGIFSSFEEAYSALIKKEVLCSVNAHISQDENILAYYTEGYDVEYKKSVWVKKKDQIIENPLTQDQIKEMEYFSEMFKKNLPYIFIEE